MNTTKELDIGCQDHGQEANQRKYEVIKIAVDVHAESYVCCRQLENATPQPPQKMSPEDFLKFVAKQLPLCQKLWVCYEAGPTGFWLARKLQEQAVECVVVRPCRLDAYGRRVNNDRTDVMALSERLDRYVAGNQKALATVRIPTLEEELKRAEGRQRDQLHKKLQSFAAMGRSLMLLHGHRMQGEWWETKGWEVIERDLPEALVNLLIPLRQSVQFLAEHLKSADGKLASAQANQERPLGCGAKTLALIDQEVCDWNRFGNRKQIGSYGGLCGGISASGNQHADLPITKAGNPRLRRYVVEMAWRMVYWQPQSPLIQRWKHVLLTPKKSHVRGRKKAIIAVARRLLVDLWRWRTGRVTLEQLGWKPIGA